MSGLRRCLDHILGGVADEEEMARDELLRLRVRILRVTLLALVLAGLPFIIEATPRFIRMEAWNRLIIHDALYLTAVFGLLGGRLLRYKVQVFLLLMLFFVWGAHILLLYGFTGAGFYALFILPIFATILLDSKRGMWTVTAGGASVIVAGLSVTQGWARLDAGIFADPSQPKTWLLALGTYVSWTLLITVCLHLIQRRLRTARDEAEENAQHLKTAKENLEAEMALRERSENELEGNRVLLQRAQRLEAIGRLAGGVAHDFNNLLTSIACSTELVLEKLAEDSPLRAEMEEIARVGGRASGLVQQLLAFASQQVIAPRVLRPNEALERSLRMLRRLLDANIDLVFKPARDLGFVKADPAQFEQLVMNLVLNARDAMPYGGRLTVETRNTRVEPSPYASFDGLSPGDYVVLSVTDTGHGMDAQTKATVFEPFFTTKSRDEGTGLGLSTVYGIVKQNGGGITIDSSPGAGSTFTVYLPRASERPEPDAPGATAALPDGFLGAETVLLVEDESRVRRVARRALERHGYQVLEASDAESADAVFREDPERVDLLLTDVMMPGLNGRELYERLALQKPGLPVLFMSGYAEDIVSDYEEIEAPAGFIHKPFNSRDLARKLREVLEQ